MSPPRPANLHGTVVLVGADGILIRGASGSGKSRLALDLVERARAAGRFAALVADDRVDLTAAGGRLVARVPAVLAGLVEIRGFGIAPVDFEPAAVIRLVVDLGPEEARMPPPEALTTDILGVRLARLAVPSADPGGAALVLRSMPGLLR